MTCRSFEEASRLVSPTVLSTVLYERRGGVLRDVNVHARFCSRSAEGHAPSAGILPLCHLPIHYPGKMQFSIVAAKLPRALMQCDLVISFLSSLLNDRNGLSLLSRDIPQPRPKPT